MFEIDKRLQEDTILIGKFPLSYLLLMNDSNYPWFILVPEKENIKEIFELSPEERIQLIEESAVLSENLSKIFNADKMNIAALGNVVHQLHVHHIVRYKIDKAWPASVWGKFPAIKYSAEEIQSIINQLKNRTQLKNLKYL
jgi:diadenosine tetraphosphate (Ap4A) HIT family hydrolase